MKHLLATCLLLTAAATAAGLDFEKTLMEIHAPADAKTVTADFKFTNTSDRKISVVKYDAACSCMAVKIAGGKLNYAPGESGIVRADFELGNFSGTVDKVVALWLEGDKEAAPSAKLTVRVHIPVLVALDPKTLSWDLHGGNDWKPIVIRMSGGKPIRVTGVSTGSDAFEHQLKTVTEGESYQLEIRPKTTATPGLAVFRIETDAASERHRVQQVFAVVRKNQDAK
jgi:hypothetical protein